MDADATFGRTFSRLKPSLEAIAKKKAVKGDGTDAQPKTQSLAERMKAARQNK